MSEEGIEMVDMDELRKQRRVLADRAAKTVVQLEKQSQVLSSAIRSVREELEKLSNERRVLRVTGEKALNNRLTELTNEWYAVRPPLEQAEEILSSAIVGVDEEQLDQDAWLRAAKAIKGEGKQAITQERNVLRRAKGKIKLKNKPVAVLTDEVEKVELFLAMIQGTKPEAIAAVSTVSTVSTVSAVASGDVSKKQKEEVARLGQVSQALKSKGRGKDNKKLLKKMSSLLSSSSANSGKMMTASLEAIGSLETHDTKSALYDALFIPVELDDGQLIVPKEVIKRAIAVQYSQASSPKQRDDARELYIRFSGLEKALFFFHKARIDTLKATKQPSVEATKARSKGSDEEILLLETHIKHLEDANDEALWIKLFTDSQIDREESDKLIPLVEDLYKPEVGYGTDDLLGVFEAIDAVTSDEEKKRDIKAKFMPKLKAHLHLKKVALQELKAQKRELSRSEGLEGDTSRLQIALLSGQFAAAETMAHSMAIVKQSAFQGDKAASSAATHSTDQPEQAPVSDDQAVDQEVGRALLQRRLKELAAIESAIGNRLGTDSILKKIVASLMGLIRSMRGYLKRKDMTSSGDYPKSFDHAMDGLDKALTLIEEELPQVAANAASGSKFYAAFCNPVPIPGVAQGPPSVVPIDFLRKFVQNLGVYESYEGNSLDEGRQAKKAALIIKVAKIENQLDGFAPEAKGHLQRPLR